MKIDNYEMDFLKELIAIPSVGGEPEEGAPYGRYSRQALQFFIDRASEAGFATGITDDKVGYVEFGSGSRLIGIVCHLDVVPQGTGWDTDPFTLTIKDGNMYGRGIVDDKGPACAAYFAMKRLKDSGYVPSSRIRLILGSDEERTCSCVETYAEKCEIPDFAITPDADFPVIFAEKGILHVKISGTGCSGITAKAGNAANMVPNEASLTFGDANYEGRGKTSHASRPELGVNAILDLVDKLAGTDIIGRSSLLTYIAGNISGKEASDYTGIGFTDISGGITANPAILDINEGSESLVIDMRYPVTAKHKDIVKFMTDAASRYGLNVEVINHMGPLFKEKDTDEIKLLTGIWSGFMSSYDGYRPEYDSLYTSPLAIGGGTYARHLPNTVAFGLTPPWQEDQCHQANEHMSVNDFETNVDLLMETIKSLA